MERVPARRNAVWLFFAGWLPAMAVVMLVAARLLRAPLLFYLAAAVYVGLLLIVSVRFTSWRCPRCRKWFHSTWWYYNSFARKCVHCGLKKYADE
jgi:hypothetical protein